jgi:sulfate adenylyltransferase subunit 1 (EFTu-like GTPase family)
MKCRLTHLQTLESEAIHVIREVVADPVPRRPRRHRHDFAKMLAFQDRRVATPLLFCDYHRSRATGSLIVVDEATSRTVGAGTIVVAAA